MDEKLDLSALQKAVTSLHSANQIVRHENGLTDKKNISEIP